MTSVLVVDEPARRVEEWRAALEAAGYRIVQSATDDGATVRDARVAARRRSCSRRPPPDCRAWEFLEALRTAGRRWRDVPVVVIVGAGRARRRAARRDRRRGALPGRTGRGRARWSRRSTRCSRPTRRRRPSSGASPASARSRCSARIESRGAASDDDVHPRLVHLTRLEHAPVRADVPRAARGRAPAARRCSRRSSAACCISSRPKAA